MASVVDADVRWLQRLENYERALATLKRALALAATRPFKELEQLGLIQTFQFTHELIGLLPENFLVDQGVSGISGYRDAVRQAVIRELLAPGTASTWMAMIRSRNLTSHTYLLPVVFTNCSNNYGPWQFPEKLIPVVILKTAAGEAIPLYGDGLNVRYWLYVEDHVDALLLAACRGQDDRSYCVGGHGERTNREVVEAICNQLDQEQPKTSSHTNLITPVTDRLRHDRRYAINPTRITNELGWKPRHKFAEGLTKTVRWYLKHSTFQAR